MTWPLLLIRQKLICSIWLLNVMGMHRLHAHYTQLTSLSLKNLLLILPPPVLRFFLFLNPVRRLRKHQIRRKYRFLNFRIQLSQNSEVTTGQYYEEWMLLQNLKVATASRGAMSDPASSGNFHVSFAANNQATMSQAEAVNNKHGNLSHTFAPSYISPIGSPQPTMQITSSELFKRLVKAAHTYDVAKLKYHEKSRQRRVTFLDWIHGMADVTFTQEATMHVLQNYPNMPEVDPAVNIVLSQLFRAYMERNIKPYIDSVPMTDGIGIVTRLQKVFAPTTHADFSRALQDLQELQMHAGESVSSFMKRFHTCTTHMRDVAQTPHALPSEFSITLMFLDKLNAGVTHMDLRALLTNYHLSMQACTDTDYLPISISEIELSLTDMEARLTCRTCGSKDHTTPYCPRSKAKIMRHPKEEKKPQGKSCKCKFANQDRRRYHLLQVWSQSQAKQLPCCNQRGDKADI